MRFQNGSNKVAIELRVVQFWSEIILVISNRTRAARSFDFEITRMISDQIALHSVQLPLYIASDLKFCSSDVWKSFKKIVTLLLHQSSMKNYNMSIFDIIMNNHITIISRILLVY